MLQSPPEPPETAARHIYLCRCFIKEARATLHRHWAFTLLNWAAEHRLRAYQLKQAGAVQKELFP